MLITYRAFLLSPYVGLFGSVCQLCPFRLLGLWARSRNNLPEYLFGTWKPLLERVGTLFGSVRLFKWPVSAIDLSYPPRTHKEPTSLRFSSSSAVRSFTDGLSVCVCITHCVLFRWVIPHSGRLSFSSRASLFFFLKAQKMTLALTLLISASQRAPYAAK